MKRVAMLTGIALIAAVACLQIAGVVYILLDDFEDTFAADTRASWTAFASTYPDVASQFLLVHDTAILGSLVISLLALALTIFGVRRGQQWAWTALWLMPAYVTHGAWRLLGEHNGTPYAYLYFGLAVAAAAGLALTAPAVFSTPRVPTTPVSTGLQPNR